MVFRGVYSEFMNLTDLANFLSKAQAPHANGTSNATRLEDGSVLISYEDGDWKFRDEFYGGEPYGGREIIHYKQKPVWIMVYYGRVYNTQLSADDVYDFLRLALQFPPKDLPLRGPDEFKRDRLTYRNSVSGDLSNYQGVETIFEDGTEIYRATYQGGLVDQRADTGF